MSIEQDLSEMNILFVHSELDDYPLTPEEFRVYGHLVRRAKDRKARPGLQSLADKCRIHIDTARSVVRRLEAYGLIRIEERGKQGLPNFYHLTKRSAWKTEAEVLVLQEQFAAEGKAKRQAKKSSTPSLQTTPPETKGGVGNEGTPPPRNEGRGGLGNEGRGGGGNEGRRSISNKVIQQGYPDRQDKTASEETQGLSGQSVEGEGFEVDDLTQGGAERAEAADAAGPELPDPSQVQTQPLPGGNANATGSEELPGAAGGRGAALAALTGALAGMHRSVPDLIAEYPFRELWLELPTARIRELTAEMQLEHGKRKYRGALIDALDEEARALHAQRKQAQPAPAAAPQPDDDDVDWDDLIRKSPLNGYGHRRTS